MQRLLSVMAAPWTHGLGHTAVDQWRLRRRRPQRRSCRRPRSMVPRERTASIQPLWSARPKQGSA